MRTFLTVGSIVLVIISWIQIYRNESLVEVADGVAGCTGVDFMLIPWSHDCFEVEVSDLVIPQLVTICCDPEVSAKVRQHRVVRMDVRTLLCEPENYASVV